MTFKAHNIENDGFEVAKIDAAQVDYSLLLTSLKERYRTSKRPIEVDFKKLIGFHSGIDRYTHLIHSYPAKLILNIPYFFLHCSSIIEKKGVVLDPFCGSGTVLLEAMIHGHDSIGADSNPLARLISQVKATKLNEAKIDDELENIIKRANGNLSSVFAPQDIVNWNYWLPAHVQESLRRIVVGIQGCEDDALRHFFHICLSSCIRRLSFADPNVSVPVRLNPERYTGKKRQQIKKQILQIQEGDVFEVFKKSIAGNKRRVCGLNDVDRMGGLKGIYDDARTLNKVSDGTVDLIITSPPYAGAQKYIRSSSLSLGWLAMCPDGQLRNLEKKNIGREHYTKAEYERLVDVQVPEAKTLLKQIFKINPLRAHIAANYLLEMEAALGECYRVLKNGSYMVLVIGNNMVCNKNFETRKYMTAICQRLGFVLELVLRDNINSRGLMTKRNKTASIITCEWILLLRKQ